MVWARRQHTKAPCPQFALTTVHRSSPAYLAVCAVNGGNYVMLPTPGSIAMFEGWSAAAPDGIKENQHDQQFLDRIWDKIFRRCTALWGCNNIRNEVRTSAAGSPA